MKKTIIILFVSAFLGNFLNACGPSQEEKRQQEQARQDSLQQLRQQKMAQQRQDSIAQARQNSIAAAKNKDTQPSKSRQAVSFKSSGSYTVQVESWRSKEKAQNQVQKWKDRGFDNAFVVDSGDKDIGDVWFRVRLGRVDNKETARELQDNLQDEFGAKSWIANAK